MTDLNSLLGSSGNGWFVTEADAINDVGQIAGRAVDQTGAFHTVLLTPVPEPATLTLLALGVVGLSVMRRRWR